MLKNIFIILFTFLLSIYTSAQSYFNKTYDLAFYGGATSVLPVDDGYLVLGNYPTANNRSFVLFKIDLYGDTLWTKHYGQPPVIYYTGLGKSLIKTSDGGYAFAGTYRDTANVGNYDALLVKFNVNGDTLWTKKIGGLQSDHGKDCLQTSDGEFMLIGTTYSYDIGMGDMYLIKTDNLGNLQWQKTYGGANYDSGISIDFTNDGGYILSGYTESFGQGIYIVKVDSIGNQQWQKVIITNQSFSGFIIQTDDGGYLMYSTRNNDGYFVKLDSLGNIIWERTYAGGMYANWFFCAYELSDGSFIAAGSITNASNAQFAWLMKISSNGDSLWSRIFDGPGNTNLFYSVRPTWDNGFVMAGFVSAPTQDFWVVKVDSNGCFGCDSALCTDTICNIDTIVGVKEKMTNSEAQITVYPNPFTNTVIIEYHLPENAVQAELIISDLTGRERRKYNVTNKPSLLVMYGYGLKQGMYIVQLKVNGAVIENVKLFYQE